ncbi:ATPase [Agrobacterium tumefaciens]|nr:hypothetical protein X971_2374 [Agrobacterium tumefaciens LBA4213 (Ach5)]AKC08062.1 ATPase [Agrobacterium tumefaciens]AYM16902.1 ATPase [Agrobacterium tumefaciens]AYM68203.1 ATPase [Agrobacterium tumefaciens]CUW94396.1 conserved hypothetical protein [Agrobacterium fabacearum TT111]
MHHFIILSGCSGGGKSTLLAELAHRGFATVEEPGRRIVIEETRNNGTALPWIDLEAFARRAIAMAGPAKGASGRLRLLRPRPDRRRLSTSSY